MLGWLPRWKKKDTDVPPLEELGTLQHILEDQAWAASLLLFAAVSAFFCANWAYPIAGVPLSDWYTNLWQTGIGLAIESYTIAKPLHLWINDGLMAIFFFFVGLEIKRELLIGELSNIRKAILPIAGAVGGMVCPAVIFTLINWSTPEQHGWGIPMATDIAFCAGILGLFAKRIPHSVSVFLIALAIVDDLGAVLVIALFYTEGVKLAALEAGVILILLSYTLSRLGVRSAVVFVLLFVLVWFVFLESGVHATIAGVLFAFTIPLDNRYDRSLFVHRIMALLHRFDEADTGENPRMVNARQQRVVRAIENECIHVEAPLQRIENKLHPFVAFLIMPIFAFANAGVPVDFAHVTELLFRPVTLGAFFGLLLGKQIGIFFSTYIAVRLGIGRKPEEMSWGHLYALSWLGGIGFTMALFIAELAFAGGHGAAGDTHTIPAHLVEAKIGILSASVVCAIVGAVLMAAVSRKPQAAAAH